MSKKIYQEIFRIFLQHLGITRDLLSQKTDFCWSIYQGKRAIEFVIYLTRKKNGLREKEIVIKKADKCAQSKFRLTKEKNLRN